MDPVLIERARVLAQKYRIVLEPDEDGGYTGSCLEMPGVMDEGKTPDACVEAVREAIVGVIAYYYEEGKTPPMPSNGAQRTAQVNVRLTEEEKLLIANASKRDGFSGLSDFIRAAALISAQG